MKLNKTKPTLKEDPSYFCMKLKEGTNEDDTSYSKDIVLRCFRNSFSLSPNSFHVKHQHDMYI